jgi:hypothetical protein
MSCDNTSLTEALNEGEVNHHGISLEADGRCRVVPGESDLRTGRCLEILIHLVNHNFLEELHFRYFAT